MKYKTYQTVLFRKQSLFMSLSCHAYLSYVSVTFCVYAAYIL